MNRLLVLCSLILAACASQEPTGEQPLSASETATANDEATTRPSDNDESTAIAPETVPPITPDTGEGVDPAEQSEGPEDATSTSDSADTPTDAADAPADATEDIANTNEPQTFIDITQTLVGNAVKRRYGIAVTDFDLDGDLEVVVTGYGAANEVWDFNDGQIENVAPSDLTDPERRAIGVAACDVDGDGTEELYFLNVDRFGGLGEVSDRLYRRTADGWRDVFENSSNQNAVNRFSGRSVLCFDRTGDGQYGVFVANYGGPMKLFEVDDEWRLTDRAPELGMNLITGGRSLINLPAPDGRMQLFAGNENGPNFFFSGTNPSYENIAEQLGIADRRETVRGVAVLDADEDGKFDLVYGNWNGPHRLFLNRDDAFVDVATEAMAAPSPIRTVIAADFDNDGYEELFWNQIGAPNRLFRKVGEEWVVADIGPALEPEGLGTGGAIVDIDGDGRLELFVAHGESGAQPLSVFRWGANNNHYLRVRPLTRQGGPARGAVVVIDNNQRTQRRVIDAGSGYLCQMEPVAHFGLGDNDSASTVTVTWPDGAEVVRENISADQLIDIPHPSTN